MMILELTCSCCLTGSNPTLDLGEQLRVRSTLYPVQFGTLTAAMCAWLRYCEVVVLPHGYK